MPGMKATMSEFAAGGLHSGSKTGPVVKNRKQAIAIGLSEQRKAQGGGTGASNDPPVKQSPPSLGDAITGRAVPTKRSRRGRGVSKNSPPQTQHLAKLQSAHSKGDFAAARSHALNYAKATLGGIGQPTTSLGGAPNTATLTVGSPQSEGDPADVGDDKVRQQTLKPASSGNPRAALARIAMMSRRPLGNG